MNMGEWGRRLAGTRGRGWLERGTEAGSGVTAGWGGGERGRRLTGTKGRGGQEIGRPGREPEAETGTREGVGDWQ